MAERYLVSFERPAPDLGLAGELAAAGAPIAMQSAAQSYEMTKHYATVEANSENEALATVKAVLEGEPYSRFEVSLPSHWPG